LHTSFVSFYRLRFLAVLSKSRFSSERRVVPFPVADSYTSPANVPSPATLQVTVTSVLRSKNLKTRILAAIRDALDVLGALEALMLRVFAFTALMYLLFRMIR